MKYLLLPLHLLKFWYLESWWFFLTLWKNLILYLEEDLAVGLMWKLLFTPLFHDSSFVGRILSFIFRLAKILIGLLAFLVVTILVIILMLVWFGLPIILIYDAFGVLGWIVLFAGVGFFIIHIFTHPHKKVYQIKLNGDLWQASLVKRKGINKEKLFTNHEVQNLLGLLEITDADIDFIEVVVTDQLGQTAFELAKKTASKYIGFNHFLVAAVKLQLSVANELLKYNLTVEDFEKALNFQEKRKSRWRKVYLWDSDFAIHHLKGINRGWLGVPTPTLDSFSEDLTRQASKVGYADFLGRTTVISEIINILSTESLRNVCLVGPAGSGKSSLIKYLAKQIISGDAPPALATKRLVLLDFTKLVSGVKVEGDLADRIKQIFEEAKASGNIILVMEEIHNFGDAFTLIESYLESGEFQFLATTEDREYSKIIEARSSFARLFTRVNLSPATVYETEQIIEEKAILIERKEKISTTFKAITKMVKLAEDLIRDRVLPDSALNILEEAKVLAKSNGNKITEKQVAEVVGKRVNVPTVELGNEGKQELLHLEELIHQRLIDQVEAVKKVADTLRRSATGLREKNRPIGSFLFVGPTGVGKTELAKALAQVYFNKKNEDVFHRFDMSEYLAANGVGRLIGLVGTGGELTEVVKKTPYCLILLDEFEKASGEILNLFLQVLDDGRLTDGTGKVVDFTNTIIIATSNAASINIARSLEAGQTSDQLEKSVHTELLSIFKPELLNRFDEVVIFKPLSFEDLQKVVLLKLQALELQLKEQGYIIEFDPGLISDLAKRGFDKVLGARPLNRLIQDSVEAKLSRLILENKLAKGVPFKVGVELL